MATVVVSVNTAWNVLNFRAGLVRALQDAGHDVVALTPTDDAVPALGGLGVRHVALPMAAHGVSVRGDARLLVRYRRALEALRPEVFLGFTVKPNVWGSLACHSLGVPAINNVSGLGTAFVRTSPLTAVVSGLYATALRRSHTVFFQNGDDLGLFRRAHLVRRDHARLLPGSGIDLARFAPAPLPGGDRVRFLLVARLLRDKGVVEFAEAAQRVRAAVPAAEFRLLGPLDPANPNAVSRAELDGWVADGRLTWLGATDDVRPAMAEADCVVLPSYREGLPRTLLEGSALGRPLVATDVPGCRQVVDDGANGFLCPARDAGGLADALLRMARLPPAARAAMGEAARRKVEAGYDERVVHRRYVDAVEAALRGRPTP